LAAGLRPDPLGELRAIPRPLAQNEGVGTREGETGERRGQRGKMEEGDE